MVHVQAQWGGHPAFPLISLGDQFWRFATTRDVFFLARGLTVIAYLALLVPIVRQPRFRVDAGRGRALVSGIFAMPLLSSVLISVGRFGLVAFPMAFAMADIGLRRSSRGTGLTSSSPRPPRSCSSPGRARLPAAVTGQVVWNVGGADQQVRRGYVPWCRRKSLSVYVLPRLRACGRGDL